MFQVLEYAKMALRNIVSNKLRSLLTMLGIIIGIGAVIMVLSIGSGSQQLIDDQLSGIANGSVYVMVSGDSRTRSDYITDEDIAAIADIGGIAGVTMVRSASGTVRGTRDADVAAYITTGNEAMNIVMPSQLQAGRFWNASDYATARKVCTIDAAGAVELFGSDNVVGMTLRLSLGTRSEEFTIVGITASTRINIGPTVTAQISVPITGLRSMNSGMYGPYGDIALLATDASESASLAKQAVNVLELRHSNAGRDMYFVMDVGQYMEQINTVVSLFTMVIAAVAAISLLVGGIGVMNIMLVSVTERTREIGIRKALGAKTRTILFQFLVESGTLTLVGGVVGIILGAWGGAAIGNAMGIAAGVELGTMVGIALFSSAIGIFFGIYPARKAARLNPIEALRSE